MNTGWIESSDGMLCNNHPVAGGIIDRNPVLDKWFVIFNNDKCNLDYIWYDTKPDAIAAFIVEFTAKADSVYELVLENADD